MTMESPTSSDILVTYLDKLFREQLLFVYCIIFPFISTSPKSKTWTLLVAAMLMGTMSFAQSIHFNYTDGTNAAYNLVDIRKVTFDADVMNLHLLDGSVYAWNVSTIGYYQYDESSVSALNLLNNANAWEVNVYPNPTSDYLVVTSPKRKPIVITNQVGQRVYEDFAPVTINTTNFSNGIYFVQTSGDVQKVVINK